MILDLSVSIESTGLPSEKFLLILSAKSSRRETSWRRE
jgi:hypothetical protein